MTTQTLDNTSKIAKQIEWEHNNIGDCIDLILNFPESYTANSL